MRDRLKPMSRWAHDYTPSERTPPLPPLTLVTWNIQSLRLKRIEVEGESQLNQVIQETKPDIMFLQETCLRARREPRTIHREYKHFCSSMPDRQTRTGKPVQLQDRHLVTGAGVLTLVHRSLGSRQDSNTGTRTSCTARVRSCDPCPHG